MRVVGVRTQACWEFGLARLCFILNGFNEVPADVGHGRQQPAPFANPVITANRGDHTVAVAAAAAPFIQQQDRAGSKNADVKWGK